MSDSSIKLSPLLDSGILAFVVDGPVSASGYDWYLIEPLANPDEVSSSAPSGWVAGAAKTGEPWLALESYECPAMTYGTSPWTALGTMVPQSPFYWGLVCYGGEDFTLSARLGTPEATCGIDNGRATAPSWLDPCTQDPHYLFDDSYEWRPAFAPGVDLGFAAPADAPRESSPFVEVTGRFDHEAARKCYAIDHAAEDPSAAEPMPDPRVVVARCRAQFVVTAIGELSERLEFIRNGSSSCEGGELAGYGVAGGAFVVLNVMSPGELMAEVFVRDGLPNTTYKVQLIQSEGLGGSTDDCFVDDAALTTDSLGDGHVSVHEPRHAQAVDAWVYAYHLANSTGPVSIFSTRLVGLSLP